jgi:pimeloyl-ACP methyl ester carboxylesterase
MSSVPLHFRHLEPSSGQGRAVVILHGLLGSSDNWGSIGKELSSPTDPSKEAMDVYLVDLRDHGRSPHTDRIDYPSMAADVHDLVERESLKDIILVGHSMGGKVAMVFAQRWPELLHRLIVVDISPREHVNNHDHILEALSTADLSPGRTRKEVEEHVSQYVKEPGVVQFLMKNLFWNDRQELQWRMNVQQLKDELPKILAAIGPERVDVPTLFIRGGQSNYIEREDLPAIKEQFPNSRVETVPYAGHWVHAQAPDEVIAMIRDER